ncbi:hypothetical protein WJX74_003370 [Apatococcus lobatus]|uniref:26S proteasome regulatory subunit RPN7 n=1 Tax=Apatococcus lobatus TaxID=904363 RepID=A0AAW1S9C0_9CHLO
MAAPEGTVEEAEKVDFKIELAHQRFQYQQPGKSDKEKGQLQKAILEVIFAEKLAPFYLQVCQELGWPLDEARLAEMETANKKQLQELDAKVTDAKENLGDTEVKTALLAKADYLCKLGDREAAAAAYKDTEDKTTGSGPKLDLVFSMLRLDMANNDWQAVRTGIAKAKKLGDEGGDWERKNRLKVYEAVFLMATRSFKEAAHLFLDSMATFSTNELFAYERCIFYAVITSIITLDRVSLRTKVVDAPEILTVIDAIPHLSSYLNCFYKCQYKQFYQAFVPIMGQLREDRFLHAHFRYYVREVRCIAYSQFLESYKSVTLQSMADSFGVGIGFMDQELSEFIVAGRLPAKIDKVAGIIETNRPDTKNAQYQQTIKSGDLLLNRLQKLSKVIDIE